MRCCYYPVWAVMLALMWAAPASAQPITVTLEGAGDNVGPITTLVHVHHWGTVRFAGQPVGTFMIRRDAANVGAAAAVFPAQSVSIWIRVTGVAGTLLMQGATLTADAVPYLGSVTVVPPGLEFLRGAAFSLTSLPLAGVQQGQLTFQP